MGKFIRLSKTVLLLLVLALLVITAANCAAKNGDTGESILNETTVNELTVSWIYDWNEALDKAQDENKPIMIDFYTDWCHYCKVLDTDTYSDDDLSAFLNDNFICLKSNAEETDLYESYGVKAYPTIVFTSPEGIEFGKIVGYKTADDFYQDTQEKLSQWEP